MANADPEVETRAEIKAWKDTLEKELSKGSNFEGRVGRLDYWMTYILMLASLTCSVGALWAAAHGQSPS